MNLRDYQLEAVNSVFQSWEENKSTLLVLPTGCGKTVCFSEIIKRAHPKRAMVIAHREELIWQAKDKIEAHSDLECQVEMAHLRADATFWNQSPVVISTVQTQNAGNNGEGRMRRFKPSDFGVLIVDEGHHATAQSYRNLFEYYGQNPDLKILGVTATPDRADEVALGKVFQAVAFDYEILDAINGGWLTPIKQQMITIDGLDFSQVRTTAGDLNGADLAAVMEAEENMQGVASASLDIIGNRRTLVFTASVKQAEMLCNILNRHRQGMASWVCGKTDKEERRKLLKEFSSGETQVMVNCGVLTEGYDNPSVEIIIQARPTKSRCLYSQMIGRATRPLPGLVDGLGTPEERKAAIAASPKPSMLVIDFVGNSGRHKLVSTADILGGKFTDEEIEQAERSAKESGKPVEMTEELEKARELLEQRRQAEIARKARLIGKAKYRSVEISPFDVFQIEPERERGWDCGKTLSEGRKKILREKMGINPDDISYHKGMQLISEFFRRIESSLCSYGQAKVLMRSGYDPKNITFKDAGELITKLKANNWKPLEVA